MNKASAPLRVMIAGGGTGGHVIPALAIGRELRDQHGAEVRLDCPLAFKQQQQQQEHQGCNHALTRVIVP